MWFLWEVGTLWSPDGRMDLMNLWSLRSPTSLMTILWAGGSYGPSVSRGPIGPLPSGPMALRNTGPAALKHRGPAALGCTFLRPDTPDGFLTASLWAWRPNGHQAHKDAVRNSQGVSDISNMTGQAMEFLTLGLFWSLDGVETRYEELISSDYRTTLRWNLQLIWQNKSAKINIFNVLLKK